jgi:O-antigen/teichoic acid export membrane protein
MIAFSAPTALADISGVVISRVDRLILGFYWPSAEVGVYQAAGQISLILVVILSAFNMILMPMIADHYHRGDMRQLEELFRVNTKWGIYAIAPLMLVITFIPSDVMGVIFGSDYIDGAAALVILCLGQFVNIATGATGTLLIMTGRQTTWFRLSIVALVANLTLNLTLIPRWGMIGAATATATTVGALLLSSLLIVNRTLRLWPYDRRYLKGIAAAAAAAVALFGVQQLALSPLPNLLVTATVATLVFFGVLILLGLDPEDRSFIELLMRRVKAR